MVHARDAEPSPSWTPNAAPYPRLELVNSSHPPQRTGVALTVLFGSTCGSCQTSTPLSASTANTYFKPPLTSSFRLPTLMRIGEE